MASRAQGRTTDTTSTTRRDTRQQQLAQDEDDVELLLHGRADGEHLIDDDEGLVHQIGIFNLSYLPKLREENVSRWGQFLAWFRIQQGTVKASDVCSLLFNKLLLYFSRWQLLPYKCSRHMCFAHNMMFDILILMCCHYFFISVVDAIFSLRLDINGFSVICRWKTFMTFIYIG